MKNILIVLAIFGAWYWYKNKTVTLPEEQPEEPFLKSAFFLNNAKVPVFATNLTGSGMASGSGSDSGSDSGQTVYSGTSNNVDTSAGTSSGGSVTTESAAFRNGKRNSAFL